MERGVRLPLPYPDKETIRNLVALFRENPDDFRAAAIPPPKEQVEKLAGLLDSLAPGLVNSGISFDNAFDQSHAPAHILGDAGLVFQIVNFSHAYSREAGIDKLLRYPDEWGDRALAIGGIVDYGLDDKGYFGKQPGVLAVLLRQTKKGLIFQLRRNPPEQEGDVTLLERDDEADHPYSFFLPDRTVFSQLQMQACLDLAVPADEAAQASAGAALAELIDAGLLPDDSDVFIEGARATVVGADGAGSLPIDEVEDLGPDLVLAAALPFVEETAGELDITFGDGVLAVIRDIADFVATREGQIVTLEAGAYRLDIADDGVDLVGQLVSAGHPEYYFPLRAGQLAGTPVAEGAGEPEGAPGEEGAEECAATDAGPLVAIDGVCILSYCKRKMPQNPRPCYRRGVQVAGKWSVSVCFGQ